jgi:RNA polymerase sigma factor (sigma-70 family)
MCIKSTTTEPPRPNPIGEERPFAGKDQGIGLELIKRISAGDPEAWAVFLGVVHERACRMVQDALAGQTEQRSATLERLIRAYQGDELQIQAALLTAQTAFRRGLLERCESAQITDERDYVSALINLTYNRWQSRNYVDKKMRRQTAAGQSHTSDDDSLSSWLTQAPDPSPGPDHQPILQDFYENLVEEIHLMSSTLKPHEREIVFLRLFERLTYEQIHQRVGKSIATVQGVCQRVLAHLRRRFRDSLP